jgi:hypothetical protein
MAVCKIKERERERERENSFLFIRIINCVTVMLERREESREGKEVNKREKWRREREKSEEVRKAENETKNDKIFNSSWNLWAKFEMKFKQ